MKPTPIKGKTKDALDRIADTCQQIIGIAMFYKYVDNPSEASNVEFKRIAHAAIDAVANENGVPSSAFVEHVLAGTCVSVLKILGVDLSQLK